MGVDNLIATTGSGLDMVTAATGSGLDMLTAGATTQVDQLAASTGAGDDKLTATSGGGNDSLSGVTGTHTTEGGTLDDIVPSTVEVISTAGFPSSGTFKIYSGGSSTTVTYTGKTAASFTGCTIQPTTFVYLSGDKCEIIEEG